MYYMQVETVEDYNEYCHYVAGLVGLGLSKLVHASGKEELASDALSNSMGLFLQAHRPTIRFLIDLQFAQLKLTFFFCKYRKQILYVII